MTAALLIAIAIATHCPRYGAYLAQANVPPSGTLPAIQADFDNDGVLDLISPSATFFYFYALTVYSGATGAQLVSIPAGPGGVGFNGYSIVSFNQDGSYPSIVLAIYRYDPGVPTGFAPTAQKLAINNAGVWGLYTLPVNLPGRDVACTRGYPGRSNPVCFFAGYYDYGQSAGTSKLMEVRADGTVTDMTFAAGLPFPSFVPNGRFMIGATWLDVNGDTYPDLVAVGQHSQILTAISGSLTHAWHGPALDYMRAFAYMGPDLPLEDRPPCVYLALEPGAPGNFSDRVTCYDRAAQVWYDPARQVNGPRLPASWSYERPVRMWRWANQQVVYAAANGGTLNLFTLLCQP